MDRRRPARAYLPAYERLLSVWRWYDSTGSHPPSSTGVGSPLHYRERKKPRTRNARYLPDVSAASRRIITKWVDAVELKRRLCKRWVESSVRVACATKTGANMRARTLRMMGMSCPQFSPPSIRFFLCSRELASRPHVGPTQAIAPINQSDLVTTASALSSGESWRDKLTSSAMEQKKYLGEGAPRNIMYRTVAEGLRYPSVCEKLLLVFAQIPTGRSGSRAAAHKCSLPLS